MIHKETKDKLESIGATIITVDGKDAVLVLDEYSRSEAGLILRHSPGIDAEGIRIASEHDIVWCDICGTYFWKDADFYSGNSDLIRIDSISKSVCADCFEKDENLQYAFLEDIADNPHRANGGWLPASFFIKNRFTSQTANLSQISKERLILSYTERNHDIVFEDIEPTADGSIEVWVR